MTEQRQIRHGDVLLVPVDSVPASAVRVPPANGELVLAHSESGHHHVIALATPGAAELYQAEQLRDASTLTGYLRCELPVEISHNKAGPHAHQTLPVPAGTYEIRRAREWNPWTRRERRVAD